MKPTPEDLERWKSHRWNADDVQWVPHILINPDHSSKPLQQPHLASQEHVKFYDSDGREQTFHKALLCHYSKGFREALDGSSSEPLEHDVRTMVLDYLPFSSFFKWLYSGKLGIESWEKDKDFHVPILHTRCTKFYIFADQVGCPAMKRDMFTYLIDVIEDEIFNFLTEEVRQASESLPLFSGLVLFMIQICVDAEDRKDYTHSGKLGLPKEFLVAVLEGTRKRLDGPEKDEIERIDDLRTRVRDFHEHECVEEWHASG